MLLKNASKKFSHILCLLTMAAANKESVFTSLFLFKTIGVDYTVIDDSIFTSHKTLLQGFGPES